MIEKIKIMLQKQLTGTIGIAISATLLIFIARGLWELIRWLNF